MVRRSKKMRARDEEYDIPAMSRAIVRNLKEIIKRSEREIYEMLVECHMDVNKAIDRLLSQDTSQEVNSNRDKEKEDTTCSCSQEVDSSIQNREFRNGGDYYVGRDGGNNFSSDETSNVQGTHNHLAGSSTTTGIHGPYNSDLTNGETVSSIYVPISSAETVSSISVPISSAEAVSSLSVPISSAEAVSSLYVPISSAEAVSSLSVPSSSDLTNGETKRVPIISGKAVPSLSVRPSRLISAISGQRTMADVVKMSLGLSKESVTKAPVKDDFSYFSKSFIEFTARRDQLPESALVSNQNLRNDDVTYPLSNSFIESTARRYQLWESASVLNQNLHNDDYGGSRLLCDEENNKNDEFNQVQRGSLELNRSEILFLFRIVLFDVPFVPMLAKDPSASVVTSLQQFSIENDFADDLSLKQLSIRDDEPDEEEKQRQMRNVSNEEMAYQINSNETEQTAQENQYKSSAATDFTFDTSQRLNPVLTPSEPSLQMQNFNTFLQDMNQQAYMREPNSLFSAFPFDQSMLTKQPITTASSLGPRPSTSMTEMNRQAMNHHYSRPKVPLGHNGNKMNSPYSLPKQNDSYNMSPSAFQEHGSSYNNTYHHQSLAPLLPQYRNSNLPQSAVAIVPSAYDSAYGSAYGSTYRSAYRSANGSAYGSAYRSAYRSANGSATGPAYGSAYGFGTPSDNAANSRLDYGDILSSQSNGSNHLPPIQHQSANSNFWLPQRQNDFTMHIGSDYQTLISGHQNQQSPSFRQIQQEQEQEKLYRDLDERSNL